MRIQYSHDYDPLSISFGQSECGTDQNTSAGPMMKCCVADISAMFTTQMLYEYFEVRIKVLNKSVGMLCH